jgi:hypothetical protein
MAFKKARMVKADFAIGGGDHVFDAAAVTKARAVSLFDLYGKESRQAIPFRNSAGKQGRARILP